MEGSAAVLPLNDFQRLMRYWDEYQPFSGIDAIEARDDVDTARLQSCVEEELAILGVGLPIASDDGTSVSYCPGRVSVTVEVVHPADGADSCLALANHSSAELNRPFRVNVDPVIRVWVLQTTPLPHVGMTWQHWPIDGVSGADLFRRILSRYVGAPLPVDGTATELRVPDLRTIFHPWLNWRRQVGYVPDAMCENIRVSRVYTPPRPDPRRTALLVHLLPMGHPHRPEGATANDVVAAAILWALADALPERHRNLWRTRLNLLNFMDLRPFGGETLQRVWGSFLGFFFFNLPEPRPAKFDDLVRIVRDQSLHARKLEVFFASLGVLAILRMCWPWIPRRWRWSLPRRVSPITASLTNSRHRGDWSTGVLAERFGRSWRVAPLGCMVAMTADVCTKGDQLSLALTCEEGSVLSDRIEEIKRTLIELLGSPAKLS